MGITTGSINVEDIKNVRVIVEVEMKNNDVYKIFSNDVSPNFEIKADGKHMIYDFWVK